MIDIQRLGLLLRTLGRSETGVKAEQVISHVNGVPAVVALRRGTDLVDAHGQVDPGSHEPPGSQGREPQGAQRARAAPEPAASRLAADAYRDDAQTPSTALTLSRAAQVLGAVLREASRAADRAPGGDSLPNDATIPLAEREATDADTYAFPRTPAAANQSARLPAAPAAMTPFAPRAARSDASAAVSASASRAQHVDAHRSDTGSTTLSETWRHGSIPTSTAHPAARTRPLMAIAPEQGESSERLASHLQQSIEYSGVFYESHVVQWVDGTRALGRLAREPQAHWNRAAEGDSWLAAASTASQSDAPTSVLRHQLDVLESGRFTWVGDLWPGQRGTLVIENDEERSPSSEADGTPRWRTSLRLQLTKLGDISATIVLQGSRIAVRIHCTDLAAARLLTAATPALRAAVTERGLDLAGLVIAHEQDH
ncbi:MAG TPA: flagellar hook-length control protein FliK [Casimicrobiaceae bacterium]|nr:flagellar hook-length control protein FliK [Casimicrobiaceae bacterium]